MIEHEYEYRRVMEHIEVYDDKGHFMVSADNLREAYEEVQKLHATDT